MTARTLFTRLFFNGGWATDFGPNFDAAPGPDGSIAIPFLVDAENILYELDGGPHKAPGSAKVNVAALESGAAITGVFDFWKTSGATATQKRVIHVGTVIKADNADGSFSDIKTGLESGKVPSYCQFDDKLIISSTSTSDVPFIYDQTTLSNLGGSPPNFAFAVVHRGRVWAAGDANNRSRLYYSAFLDPEDWSGTGSGHIDIDPGDGDNITGLVSHNNELIVFKGPYSGSIHRITGSSPAGGDGFAKQVLSRGVGCASHNSIFRFRDDIGFISPDGLIRSLAAVVRFGDLEQYTISRPIQKYLFDHVTFSSLDKAQAAHCDIMGLVLIALPIDTSTTNNIILALDHRFEPARWALWNAFDGVSIADVLDGDASNRDICFIGGSDGFLRKLFQPTRSIDGDSAIQMKVTFPFLNFGRPFHKKTVSGGSVGLSPKSNGNITLGWKRDDNAQQTQTISQAGSADVLGPAAANQFTLGTSQLAGSSYVDQFFRLEEGGSFRAIQFQLTDTANNQDFEVHSLSAIIEIDAVSLEN